MATLSSMQNLGYIILQGNERFMLKMRHHMETDHGYSLHLLRVGPLFRTSFSRAVSKKIFHYGYRDLLLTFKIYIGYILLSLHCIHGNCPSVKSLECKNALGMESGNISDGQISASSEWNAPDHADHCRVATTYYAYQWDAIHYAHQGRLQFKADGVRGGAWSAAKNDFNPWLQVDLGSNFTRVTGLATQGRDDYDCWVTEYRLLYSRDQNSNFLNYKERGQAVAKVNTPFLYFLSTRVMD